VKQCLPKNRHIPTWIHDYYNKHTRSNKLKSAEDLRAALAPNLSSNFKVFLIIDALDEGNDGALRELFKFLESVPGVRILTTSRPSESVPSTAGWTLLPIGATDGDMRKFLDGRIRMSGNKAISSLPTKNPELCGKIIEGIVSNAQGM